MHLTDWILQGVMMALLAATIFYCVMLERRLRQFRKGEAEMRGLIEGLCMATNQANMAVAALKDSGIAAMEDRLKGEIGKARALADELALISEVAGNTADRLEQKATGLRAAQAQPDPAPAKPKLAMVRPAAKPEPKADVPEALQRVRNAISGLR